MKNEVAAAYASFLDEKNVTYFTGGEEEQLLQVTWNISEGAEIIIMHIFDRESESVRILGSGFIVIPEDRMQEAYRLCNILNKEFRWVTFYADEADFQFMVSHDAKVTAQNCGPICLEAMMNIVDIVNETYPLMKKDLGLQQEGVNEYGAD